MSRERATFRQNSPGHIAWLRRGQIEARRRMAAGEGFLYVAIVGTAIKIGFSLDPKERVRRFNARLLATMPGTIAQERTIQRELKEFSLPGYPHREFYPVSILSHQVIPDELRSAHVQQAVAA